MIHPIQFRQKYIKEQAVAYGVSVREYAECVEDHEIMVKWMAESVPWLERQTMSVRWFNAVMNNKTTAGMLWRWIKDHPVQAKASGNDYAYALAYARKNPPHPSSNP